MRSRILRFCVLLLAFPVLAPATYAAAPVRVLVWLEGEPLVAFHWRSQPEILAASRPFESDAPAVQQQQQRLAQLRRSVEAQLYRLGFETDGEVDVVLHALIGRLPEESFAEAAALPGVRAVRRVREYQKLLDGSLPVINAVSGWGFLGGETKAGRGMKVAILDTGVDPGNPMLQDYSMVPPSGFPRGELEFTNNKVIVARNYVRLIGFLLDTPNAMDRDGHGTFVAAIAAGRRVMAPQAEISGVAPGAYVGNYRVFGTFGDTTDAALVAALDDAVRDGMQVVNLSLGGFTGDVPSQDPFSQAAANAVKAGVVVVASAGNFPEPGSISSPADSPDVIGVGASNNSRIFAMALRVSDPQPVPTEVARLAVVATDAGITAPLGPLPVWAVAGSSCNPLAATDKVQNAIALFKQDCVTTPVRNAAAAGAKAVVIYRSDSADPERMTGFTSFGIPVFQMSRGDGGALANFARQAEQNQVVIDPQVVSFPVQPDRIATFSSLGPAFDMQLKPDLVAPGTSIYSAMQTNDALGFFYNASQFGNGGGGTSFSSPMVAGAALLLKQLHPTWTPAQVKSALVNTAANVITQGAQQAPLLTSGNGRLDVSAAMQAAAAFDPVSVSFSAHLLASSPFTMERTLTITNLGDAPESFSLEVKPRSEVSNVTVTVDPASTAAVRPRESAPVKVTFTANPPVSSKVTADGRIQVRGNSTGKSYSVAYWGDLVGDPTGYSLIRIRGIGQTQPVSTTLAQDLVASVRDPDLVGLAGFPVTFSVVRGGGRISATDVITDFAGLASVSLTLGDLPGINEVQASALGRTRSFIATARPNPLFPRAGVVHAASFSPTVSPGSMVSVFGTGLAAGTAAASELPLPRVLANTQLLVNGSPAPLFFVSPTQINFQLPFEVEGQTTADLRVAVVNTPSPLVSLPLAAAAPGVFTISQNGQGTAVALHGADFTPVSSQNPAKAGETVVLFATGLGPLDQTVTSGDPAPSSPPARTRTTGAIRMGTTTAKVQFSGLAPGFVGLYQVNFEVPTGLPAGDAPLTLTIGTTNSNATTLPVR